MFQPTTSTNDPIFWNHHSFVDLIWENWRQSRQGRSARETQYPPNNAACSSAAHYGRNTMQPFFPMTNIDGLSNQYTANLRRPDMRLMSNLSDPPSATTQPPSTGHQEAPDFPGRIHLFGVLNASSIGTIQTSTRPPETTRIPRLRPTNPVYSTTRATTTLTAAATSPTDGPTTTEAITVAVQPGTSAEPTLTTEFVVTTELSTSTTTTETTTTTTTTTTQQTLVPTPFIDENAKVIDKCMLVIAERVTCPKTRDDVVALSPSALSPLHYALNLSVQTVQPTVIEGDVQILLRTNEQGKQITLDVDSKLRNVEDIRVVNCDTG
nr:Tyrosinase domain containing protein [Haemonchus contortus]